MSVNRRQLLGTGAAGLGIVLSGAVGSVFGAPAQAGGPQGPGRGPVFKGYGDLVADPNGVCDLPRGFSYTKVSVQGTPLAGGGLSPAFQDGMHTFAAGRHTAIVRNHELTHEVTYPVPHVTGLVYDEGADGGNTVLVVDGGRLVSERVGLAGTVRNCAGGPTPWGTWLTCEETELSPADDAKLTKRHGYVFEVDPFGRLHDAAPVPLAALGRYAHEAVAVDPRTGTLYLTEDASGPFGLVYRFLPKRPLGGPGSLRAGGKLQALFAGGLADLSGVTTLGTKLAVKWVDVPDPGAASTSVRKQFADGTVSRVPKAEGIYFRDGSAYFVSSYAKAAPAVGLHEGQVWRYDPRANTIELVLRFAPSGPFDGPDNIHISAWGEMILCEDGDGDNHLVVVGDDGNPYPLARSVSQAEFAGATFSPDGAWLYANIQEDGVTLAIKGPWQSGRRR
ncbi:alkaline phosphatase PhoX [Pseudofrankia sp. DC12]|uniref:alkaline phosphatase PhoX n=1 Tax=Pseudofrankia sp. DC12 TaxID=683315 RepID=UPI0005F79DDB|nr:alkaline phosphatase PhoX [Pseudofrankia sp. DC12]